MSLAKYALDNKAVIFFFLALFTIGGIIAFDKLPKKEDAPFVVKQSVLVCQYPGATANEVEQLITTVIEREIQTMPNVRRVRGESYANYSYINIELLSGTDPSTMSQMWDELRKKVYNVQAKLPEGAGPITVNDDFGDVYGIYFGLTADNGISYKELRDKAEEIKTILTPLNGIRKISLVGEQTEVVNVFIPSDRLANIGVTPQEIITTLNRQNKEMAVGAKEVGDLSINVIAQATYQSISDIQQQLIRTTNGDMVRLGDIARVERGYYEPSQTLLRINGKKAIGIAIASAQDKDVVKAGSLVRQTINQRILPELPYGYSLVELYPEDTIAAQANNDFMANLLISVAVVVALLFFFYKLRTTMLICTALLFCIAATLFVMQFTGTGLNRSSLAAFIIAMGMLVDNAIVVADNAKNNIKRGMPRRQALIEGANKPMWGLFGATIIGIISFLPLYTADSAAAEIVRPLFIVLALSLGFSWFFALTQTITFGRFMLKENTGKAVKDPYDTRLYGKFEKILRMLIKHRKITLTTIAALLVGSVVAIRMLPSNFFPFMDKPYFRADLFLPDGYNIYGTSDELKKIEDHFLRQPGIKTFSTSLGNSHPRYYLASSNYSLKPNFANILIEVNNKDSTAYWENELYSYVMHNYPNIICRSSLFKLSMPTDGAIEIIFSGDRLDTLQAIADRAMEVIRKDGPPVEFLRTNWGNKIPTYIPYFSEEKGGQLGVTRLNMAQSLSMATSGMPVGIYRERDISLPILLKDDHIGSLQLDELKTLPIFDQRGNSYVLEQALDSFKLDYRYNMLWHFQRERTIVVRMDPVRGDNTNATFAAIWALMQEKVEVPEGYIMSYLGEQDTQDQANTSISAGIPMTMILIFIVLLLLFGNYRRPLAIMAMIPLIFVGVVIGLILLGKDFDFFSLLGLLGLIGMNVKSAVILVDEIVLQQKGGRTPLDSVIYAAKTRLIPVSTGAGATIVGMVPLLSDTMFGGMAATIMGGLLMATILTILVLPVTYSAIYKIKYEAKEQEKVEGE